jgi:uncharacterized protein (TIGR03085 family)
VVIRAVSAAARTDRARGVSIRPTRQNRAERTSFGERQDVSVKRPSGWPFTSVARAERDALCDLLEELGPDAPTLCEGWATADMAAHLVVRERRLDAGPGLVIPALHGRTERLERERRDSTPYDELVRLVRTGPPLPMRLPVVHEAANAAEYFVHHEDVRRPNGRSPRPADAERDEALWRQLRLGGARALRRRVGVAVCLERPDGERIGADEPDGVHVTGSVDELFLLGFRAQAADVAVGGPTDAVRRFNETVGRAP